MRFCSLGAARQHRQRDADRGQRRQASPSRGCWSTAASRCASSTGAWARPACGRPTSTPIFITHRTRCDHARLCGIQLARRQEHSAVHQRRGTWTGHRRTPNCPRACCTSPATCGRSSSATCSSCPMPCRTMPTNRFNCAPVLDGARRAGVSDRHRRNHPAPFLGPAARMRCVLLECNHDREMLVNSRTTRPLKRRIAGGMGHLPNHVAAEILARVHHAGLRHLVAAHLSCATTTPTWPARRSPARSAPRPRTSWWPPPTAASPGSTCTDAPGHHRPQNTKSRPCGRLSRSSRPASFLLQKRRWRQPKRRRRQPKQRQQPTKQRWKRKQRPTKRLRWRRRSRQRQGASSFLPQAARATTATRKPTSSDFFITCPQRE